MGMHPAAQFHKGDVSLQPLHCESEAAVPSGLLLHIGSLHSIIAWLPSILYFDQNPSSVLLWRRGRDSGFVAALSRYFNPSVQVHRPMTRSIVRVSGEEQGHAWPCQCMGMSTTCER